jgi:fatty-acyl-CoA synthase
MHGLMMNYPLTLAQILEHTHRIHGDKRVRTVLPNGKMRGYTYAALYDRVKRLANAITELGIQRGDRVATYASNTYQHLELYYAIPCIGAVLHPLNVRLSAAQLARIVHEAEDKLIFVDGAFAEQFEVLRDKIGCKRIVHFNLMPTDTDVPYEQLLREARPTYTWDIQDENWAMGLCYTSGTQGKPRGVLYTHRSVFLHTLAVNQADVFGLTEADVVLPLVPMFHAMAWGLPYACMFAGADMVLPGPKPTCLADLIAGNGVTIAAGVPTVWAKAYPELRKRRRDISSLRRLIVGGEAISPTLIEAYEKELGVEVCHAWGMTEMSPTGTFSKLRGAHQNLSDAKKWQIKAKQGRPVPGVELRLATGTSTDFAELPWDGETVGEVQVRSPWTASCYYKSEPTTEHFTADGWLRTGDLATIDAEGYMQIVDRAKALIRSGGESISSVALETALLKHPQVLDAAVIGVPDEKWGERPLAVVVPTEQTHEDISDDLRQRLAAEFPKFWIPDRFVFVDEIPKTSVGKSDKRAIFAMFASNGKR